MRKFLLALILIALTGITWGQKHPVLDWETTSGTQNFFYKNVIYQKGYETYVGGATLNGNGDYDLIVSKLIDGNHIWTQTYAGQGGGDDAAAAIVVDANGYVYVGGSTYIDGTDLNDMLLICYDNTGSQQWVETYNGDGSGDDGITAIHDDGAELYFTGTGRNSSGDLDFITASYDYSGGQNWVTYFDYGGFDDASHKIVDGGGDIIIYGLGGTSIIEWDYTLVSYEKWSGNEQDVHVNTSSSLSLDIVTDVIHDQSGNIYISGGKYDTESGYDYFLVKFDTALTEVWTKLYNSPDNLDDVATSLALDGAGNVYVTGYTTHSSQDRNYTTVKYDSSGTKQWEVDYNGPSNGADSAAGIIIIGTDVFVTGSSYNGDNYDYMTVKYDQNGNYKWEIPYTGKYGGDDKVTNIAVDTANTLIISGTSWNGSSYTYRTIKYNEISPLNVQDTVLIDSSWAYIENRGHLQNTSSGTIDHIRYFTQSSPNVYLSDTSFSYLVSKLDTTSANDSIHRIDFCFSRQESPRLFSYNQKDEIYNFYKETVSGGRSRVYSYHHLIHKDVWFNTDIQYSSTSAGFKFDIILKPGSNASNVTFTVNGADSLRVDSSTGNLIVYTSLGAIEHARPRAWQIDNTGTKSSVSWTPSYSVSGNSVSFITSSYTTTNKLVISCAFGFPSSSPAIDNLIWQTYLGGGYDVANATKYDENGNIYFTGYSSTPGFPVTAGAYQSAHAGAYDAICVKFGPNRNIIWATYLGGSDADEGRAVAFLGPYFYMTGYSLSNDFPIQPQANSYNDNTKSGPNDIIVSKFNSFNGSLVWSTFIGSSGDDRGHSLVVSNSSLFLAGSAGSGLSAVSRSGAYNQLTYGGGYNDGLIVKFDSDDDIDWMTYYGGNGVEECFSIETDGANNLWIGGRTNSTDFPLFDPGNGEFFQGTPGGGYDAYYSKLNSSGAQLWSTLYGGSGDENVSEFDGLTIDSFGNVYFTGYTFSSDLPVQNYGPYGYNQSTYGGNGDAYIFMANSSLAHVWSTYLGGSEVEYGEGIVFNGHNLITIGSTSSNDFPTQTQTGAFSQGFLGPNGWMGGDGYLSVFNSWKAMVWSTYLGGSSTDPSLGIDVPYSIDNYWSNIFIAGGTSSDDNLPTFGPIGAYVESTNSGIKCWLSEFDLSLVNLVDIHETQIGPRSINVFPNPSEGTFLVELPTNGKFTLEIFDIQGRLVHSAYGTQDKGSPVVVSTILSPGLYLLLVDVENVPYVQKISVK